MGASSRNLLRTLKSTFEDVALGLLRCHLALGNVSLDVVSLASCGTYVLGCGTAFICPLDINAFTSLSPIPRDVFSLVYQVSSPMLAQHIKCS
jgi:hypothetical protein